MQDIKPGIYWAATRGSETWNAIVRIVGKAPFLQMEFCAVLAPPHGLKEKMYVSARDQNDLVFGPPVEPPTSVPEVPADWMEGWHDLHERRVIPQGYAAAPSVS